MPDGWSKAPLSREVVGLDAGVSVNSDDRPHGIDEVGVLKTSALSGGVFDPKQHKTVLESEKGRVRTSPEADSILLSRMNTPALVGESAYVPTAEPTLFLPDRLWQLRFRDREACCVRWVAHWLQSHRAKTYVSLSATGTSGSMKNLPKSRLLAMPVLWPPGPEQRRIAEILDTVDQAIRKTEEIIAKLEHVKRGLLHDLLTRGIDDNGELRDPDRHPEQFKDSPLGRIPKVWDVELLREVAEVRSGIAKNSNRAVKDAVRVPYLRVANVQDGHLDLSDMAEIDVARADLDRYRVLPGDVLMNEGGDLDKLGRGALWRAEYDPCVHQNHVFVVRSRPGVHPAFLDAWTGAPAAKRYFMTAGKQTTNLASINKTALGGLPLVLPSIEEQRSIAALVAAHDERVDNEGQEVSKLKLLKQGLMEDLLTGRVRVTALLEEAAE